MGVAARVSDGVRRLAHDPDRDAADAADGPRGEPAAAAARERAYGAGAPRRPGADAAAPGADPGPGEAARGAPRAVGFAHSIPLFSLAKGVFDVASEPSERTLLLH